MTGTRVQSEYVVGNRLVYRAPTLMGGRILAIDAGVTMASMRIAARVGVRYTDALEYEGGTAANKTRSPLERRLISLGRTASNATEEETL